MSNQDSQPLVSVGMPLYNGEKYLKEAIDSILNQTYSNIDLVVVNDGSADNSVALVEAYDDPRIRLFHNDQNRGVSYTRNRIIEFAKGDYLAWMDCDDISLPQKIERQVELMESNKNIGVCGTSYLLFFEETVYYEDRAKNSHEDIRANFVFKPATIFMPTAMIRMAILKEDSIRFNESLASFENKKQERFRLKQSIYSRILNGVAIEATEADLLNHENCTNDVMFTDFQAYVNCTNHLRAIEHGNKRLNTYDHKVMKKVLLKKSIQWNYSNGISSLAKVALRSILRYKEYNFKNKVFTKSLSQSE